MLVGMCCRMRARICYEVVLACVKLGDEDKTAVQLIARSPSTPIPPYPLPHRPGIWSHGRTNLGFCTKIDYLKASPKMASETPVLNPLKTMTSFIGHQGQDVQPGGWCSCRRELADCELIYTGRN